MNNKEIKKWNRGKKNGDNWISKTLEIYLHSVSWVTWAKNAAISRLEMEEPKVV